MTELESVIEKRLIDQLCSGESQWTYRPDIHNEEQLWANFKYILEQNNKSKLNGKGLSDSEFDKIKNDVSHSSFYEAGKWLVGENGKVYVHVQRGNETLHLVVLNNEHIAGGTSVYEVINQYQAYGIETDDRDRRFDVTLLINGIPMIHIELKNKEHPYMDAYRQIKKYIGEGKFKGLYSNIQMFVVSNAVDTRYFSAARDTELRKKFLFGWLDKENVPVCDYIEFAQEVLSIPMAHEIVAKYTVLDNDKRKLLVLRPYQIHAIESMRAASKRSESGFIWHTTGSGKTMTSYKATRNLIMDIPSLNKTVFLLDRKDLDAQTKMAFQSYADNDTIEVDDTSDVTELIAKLSNDNRQMIVTTRQKLQILVKRLPEDSAIYRKIRSLRIAFVVDECHRAVTPEAKAIFDRFFNNSLWYGFTGTPIFEENKYELMGELPQTTEQMYGKCLHSYTIKEAIHDEAVLGFMVENLGPKEVVTDSSVYLSEAHMKSVLNVILNQSYAKLGMGNGRGEAYEGILTVGSIKIAQKYYALLKRIVEGKEDITIDEKIKQAMPDFPKFAITYSISENEDDSRVNQEFMEGCIADYNAMFGTNFKMENIDGYNVNLNDRLARKQKKYMERSQQLDLVIVVDRLLTGFDAPCLSTLYMDRQPMKPQGIIQAFSRTNRLFDDGKQYGQVVTFQSPNEFKEAIDEAIRLYSRGGLGNPVAETWEEVEEMFAIALRALRGLTPLPNDAVELCNSDDKSGMRAFVNLFRRLDTAFSHLKAFACYTDEMLESYPFSQEEYEDYAAAYKNILEKLKTETDKDEPEDEPLDDYDLKAYNKVKIDYEYIVELLQGFIDLIDPDTFNQAEFDEKIAILRGILIEFIKDNEKIGTILMELLDDIEKDKEKYIGADISVIVNQIRYDAVEREVAAFANKWFLPEDEVRFEVYSYRDGVISNETHLKDCADYAAYKESVDEPVSKFKFRKLLIDAFRDDLMAEIMGLL